MRRAVIYLRVSTLDQTTANQERELREIADRMGCEIVRVFTRITASAAPRAVTSGRHLTGCAVKLPGGNSTWSWPGRSTGWAVACRI